MTVGPARLCVRRQIGMAVRKPTTTIQFAGSLSFSPPGSVNETLFTSLAQVRVVLAVWKDDYNDVRPRSALGNLTPTEYGDRGVLIGPATPVSF